MNGFAQQAEMRGALRRALQALNATRLLLFDPWDITSTRDASSSDGNHYWQQPPSVFGGATVRAKVQVLLNLLCRTVSHHTP